MKKIIVASFFIPFFTLGFCQVDTISTNIYQYDGNFGIGVSSPSSPFEMVCDEIITYPSFGILSIKNNHYATFDALSASDFSYVGSLVNGRRSRGTLLSPENVQPDDRITGICASMYYDNAFRFNAGIYFYVGEGLGENSYPTYLVFRTTGINETSGSEKMRIDSQGRIGIGTTQPLELLDISGGIKLGFSDNSNPGTIRWTGSDFEGYTGNSWLSFTQEQNSLWHTSDTNISYNQGNVGIGTIDPSAKLQVADGDIYISDIEKGIIMKSPDGTCWRGTLDNSGNLNFITIDCPNIAATPAQPSSIFPDSDEVSIYPNPTQNEVTLVSANLSANLILKVYTINGTLLEKTSFIDGYLINDISGFDAGMYIFQVEDIAGNIVTTKKIVKN